MNRFSLPWDQQTPVGYFGEIIIAIALPEIFSVVLQMLLLLFISVCLHYFAFGEMFQEFVTEVDISSESHGQRESVRKLIAFHNQIKE